MFGYVTASWKELTAEEQKRYGAVYCGICREIRQRSTGIGRICLSYDMAFLALLLMSLYEPEEESGKKACRVRPWMTVLLAVFMAVNMLTSALALARYDARTSGAAPANAVDVLLDEHFDNARMERIYPNAKKVEKAG